MEFAERVQIKVAYSKYGVAAWLSRSRLADCCAMSSFRSPYASVAAAGLRRHGRSPVRAALDQQGPDDAGHLVGQGGGDQHARLAREHSRQPRARRGATPTGPADHRAGTQDQQSPDGPLAHLRDGSELVLAACRPLQRRQPKPGGEVPPGAEALRRRHQGGDRSRCDRPDAGDRHEPPRDGVGLGTPGNLTIQLRELLFQGVERSDQHLQDPAGALGYRRFRVFDQRDQAVDVRGTLRHHMAVLGQVPAHGVDALRPLPHQQVADPEHNSVRLMCLVLHRHKAHPRPLRRFADRLSIRHVILLPLDEGLHVSGWDQPHRVAQLAKLSRPVVRPATSLQCHKTGRLPREKLEHLGPHQALAEHHPAGRIGPVRLKYPLRNIKPYRASLAHGRLPWWLLNTTTLAHRCRRGASTPSRRRPAPSPIASITWAGAALKFGLYQSVDVYFLHDSFLGQSPMAVVLITGASGTRNGIGISTAIILARSGHTVIATMRNLESAGELSSLVATERLPITLLALDVDDDT